MAAEPRIAVVLPDLRPGGAERLHVSLAEAWRERGIGVDFVLGQARGELVDALPAGVVVTDLQAPRLRATFRPLARHHARTRPDAVLAAMWPLTAVAPLAARTARFGGRVAVSEHSPLSLAYRDRGRVHLGALRLSTALGYRLSDARIGVSAGVADDMARLSAMDRRRFEVIHNPVRPPDPTAPAAPRPATLAARTGPVVLAVGTLKAVKRFDVLIDAFARLPAELGAMLCIVGEGALRPALEARIAGHGLQDRVLMPGFAADPSPWYAAADVFVLSSDYEGFGNVIVEAMAHGVPVVCTDCPVGPREILDGGRYGRLVAPGDPAALAAAIAATLAGGADRDALRRRAGDFALDRIADQYLRLLLPAPEAGR